ITSIALALSGISTRAETSPAPPSKVSASLAVIAAVGLVLAAPLRCVLGAGNNVPPRQPTVQIDVGAAAGAGRAVQGDRPLAADRATPAGGRGRVHDVPPPSQLKCSGNPSPVKSVTVSYSGSPTTLE